MNNERQILNVLEENAHATPAQIATLTGTEETEIVFLIQKWNANGVIRRSKAVVDWEKWGEESVAAYVDLKVMPEKGAGYDAIARNIYRYPEVRSLHLVSGSHDLRCVVVGRTMREVADFVAQRLATLDRVTATSTHFVLQRYKEDGEIYAETPEDHRLMVTP